MVDSCGFHAGKYTKLVPWIRHGYDSVFAEKNQISPATGQEHDMLVLPGHGGIHLSSRNQTVAQTNHCQTNLHTSRYIISVDSRVSKYWFIKFIQALYLDPGSI